MKKIFLLLLGFIIGSQSFVNAQNICMVSADYQQAENYMVFWEPFFDNTNLDSVIIYKMQGSETVFTKIGSVKIDTLGATYFTDYNANMLDFTKYAITILDSNGIESGLSPWHQPMVLDFVNDGTGKFNWTKYRKEDQLDESYIYGYQFMMDETSLGNYQQFISFQNTDTMAFDESYTAHTAANYYVNAMLPNCDIHVKANINTSRSNIKQQIDNASMGVSVLSKYITKFELSPNPTVEFISLNFSESVKGEVWISDMNGNVLLTKKVNTKSTSFDIANLAAGIYFVNFTQNGVVSSQKFVKK